MAKSLKLFGFFVMTVIGAAVTFLAVSRWAPASVTDIPSRLETLQRAAADSQALGYRLQGEPQVRISNGHRQYHASSDIEALSQQIEDRELRRRLLTAAPPLRLGVRYWRAESPRGRVGALFLEYGGDGRLLSATFGVDGVLNEALAVESDRFVADRLARLILGATPPEPRVWSDAVRTELIYQVAEHEPAVYVSLTSRGAWMAFLVPAPYRVASRQALSLFSGDATGQVRFYVVFAAALLALGVLLWRLGQRRAGLGHAMPVLIVLVATALPSLRHFQSRPSILFAIALAYVLTQLGLLLAWSVAEAEVREVRPGSVEHWDRVLRRRPIRRTGWHLIRGVAFGSLLSAVLAASGEVLSRLGEGGYSALLVILPDYWLLPTPLHWGFATAATTAFIVGFGGRLGGRPGAMAAATVGSGAWGYMVPVMPVEANLTVAWVLSMAAGWLLWHHGLLSLLTACVTAFSLPTAFFAWRVTPYMWDAALISTLPLGLAGLGLALLRLSPEVDALPVVPKYVSLLERETRLKAEVGLLRDLQLALLPPENPCSHHVDIAWRMVPADVVGGDFLDLEEDEHGRLWLAVADVAGHGVSCSVMTAFTKAAVVQHAVAGVGAVDALRNIRRLFTRLETRRTMVTLLLAVWDPEDGSLRVASAGHPHLLLAADGEVREVGLSSLPLGTGLIPQDEEVVVIARPGDVLVAYTDGVVEACSPTGEELGYGLWPSLLPELQSLGAQEILDRLVHCVETHRAGRPAEDDLTAVVVKIH